MAADPTWYMLTRRSGQQHITGQIKLAFEWTFTREAILQLEVVELERILAQKLEVLAMLQPLPSNKVAELLPDSQAARGATSASSATAVAGGSGMAAGTAGAAGGELRLEPTQSLGDVEGREDRDSAIQSEDDTDSHAGKGRGNF